MSDYPRYGLGNEAAEQQQYQQEQEYEAQLQQQQQQFEHYHDKIEQQEQQEQQIEPPQRDEEVAELRREHFIQQISDDEIEKPLSLRRTIDANHEYRINNNDGPSPPMFPSDILNLSWVQSTPALVVGAVIAATTIPPMVRALLRYINGPSAPAEAAPTASKAVDIEDLASQPTTCSADGCDCECPFPLKKHHCQVAEDGTTKYMPIAVDVPTDGSSVWICTCGQSGKFPYCDGSHRAYNQEHGTNLAPYQVNQESCPDKQKVYVCGCGHSQARKSGKPFCDGSHKKVQPKPESPGIDDEVQPVADDLQ